MTSADDYSDFDEHSFRNQVHKALASVERVLDTDRASSIQLAEDIDHSYGQKYQLANQVTNTAIIAALRVLQDIGLTREKLVGIASSSQNQQATTLRFTFSDSSSFVKEEIVDTPYVVKKTDTTTTETSASKDFGNDDVEKTTETSTTETIVDRQIKKHFDREVKWELSIYQGTNTDQRTILGERTCRTREIRGADEPPSHIHFFENQPDLELPLTWLLLQIDIDIDAHNGGSRKAPSKASALTFEEEEIAGTIKAHFSINTSLATTKTPYRNVQVEKALKFFRKASKWARRVEGIMVGLVDHCDKYTYTTYGASKELKNMAKEIFLPALPFLADVTVEEGNAPPRLESAAAATTAAVSGNHEATDETEACIRPEVGIVDELSGSQQQQQLVAATDNLTVAAPVSSASEFTLEFLNEHARTLSEIRGKIRSKFPDPSTTEDTFLSSLEPQLLVCVCHLTKLGTCLATSLQYLEFLLEQQLVAAIGKEVMSSDLDKYVRYHNQKLLDPSPQPFCYAIRRPEHYPDGILGIEEVSGGAASESIVTHVHEIPHQRQPIEVPLNAATTVELTGKTYLHGWLKHRFGGNRKNAVSETIRLNARARQFSSFVLLVGTMVHNHRFKPRDAIILRNKDEVHIPLLLNEIPTATEFKSSIQSLSPEQQRFAQSYRSMQLDSSVLGVCIVQIKPQLERLLGLPPRALTKEMKLTEDLTELFVEYQVPSDLVSCEGLEETTAADKVASVKAHVQSVLDVIAAQKKDQLEAQLKNAEMHEATLRADGKKVRRLKRSARSRERATGMERCSIALSAPRDNVKGSAYQMSGMQDVLFDDVEDMIFDGAECIEELSPGGSEEKNNTGVHKPDEDSKDNFMAIPKILDRAIELHDPNAAIRSTTIETDSNHWTRISQKNLLAKSVRENLSKDSIATETARAFDLLDALSRSGSLSIACSELHVVVCATHRFERSVMDTVIVDNVNPIEKLELSTLLMASTILGRPARDLVRDCGGANNNALERLEASFPKLLGAPDGGDHSGDGSTEDSEPRQKKLKK